MERSNSLHENYDFPERERAGKIRWEKAHKGRRAKQGHRNPSFLDMESAGVQALDYAPKHQILLWDCHGMHNCQQDGMFAGNTGKAWYWPGSFLFFVFAFKTRTMVGVELRGSVLSGLACTRL